MRNAYQLRRLSLGLVRLVIASLQRLFKLHLCTRVGGGPVKFYKLLVRLFDLLVKLFVFPLFLLDIRDSLLEAIGEELDVAKKEWNPKLGDKRVKGPVTVGREL